MTTTVTTYEQAIEWLFGRINYERIDNSRLSARDFKLDRMRQLLAALGNPQQKVPAVHVAGSKGKGSTSVMVSGILRASGYQVGLFTSPHVHAFEERIVVGDAGLSREQLVNLVNAVSEPVAVMDRRPGRTKPTFFEIVTAMAWLFFEQQQVEIAVMEVGLGGRLDSTNVCRPEVCAITSISRDHTRLLGNTLAEIAREKAGIIKAGVPVVSGVTNAEAADVVRAVCEQSNSNLYRLGHEIRCRYHPHERLDSVEADPLTFTRRGCEVNVEHVSNVLDFSRNTGTLETCPTSSSQPRSVAEVDVETPWRTWPHIPLTLLGEHQAQNAAIAVGIADVLNQHGRRIPAEAVYNGFESVHWPLRVEVLARNPWVIADAAHNWASMTALIQTLESSITARRRIMLFAATQDKDVTGLLRLVMRKFQTVILTQYTSNPRAVPAGELYRRVQAFSEAPVHVAADPLAGWNLARQLAGPDDLICISGSFFLGSELREIVLKQQSASTEGRSAKSTAKSVTVQTMLSESIDV